MTDTLRVDSNISLRPLREKDIESALTWYADPVVLSGTISPGRTQPCSEQMIRAMYQDLASRGLFYIIEYNDGGSKLPIGDVTLSKDTMPIVIGDFRYRGRGIAKAVIQYLLTGAKAHNWERITLKEIYKENVSSQKLYESCGFTKISENGESMIYEILL
jgi:RimJ/RimL family protein N-acetyltransferase